jgi:hypothetical protein
MNEDVAVVVSVVVVTAVVAFDDATDCGQC